MRTTVRAFLCLLPAAALFVGCSEEAPVEPGVPSAEPARDDVLAETLETIAHLEKDYAELLDAEGRAGIEVVPGGSVDALEAAVNAAGPNGIVLVQPGLHAESGTVTIAHRVAIVGMPGAVLQVDTQSAPPAAQLEPALWVYGATGSTILGLEIVPAAPLGGTGVLVENSERVVVGRNTIRDHQLGVVLEQADRATVWGNTIEIGAGGDHGITVINAERARIIGNDVSGAFFGIWACDLNGRLLLNDTHGNFIGVILCRVPANAYPLPSGALAGAEFPCGDWVVRNNTSSNNLDAGYMVIDGANNNFLSDNAGSGNGTYDVELVGDSLRFGFLTPTSFENTAIIDDPAMVVKDCGLDNTVIGGTQVDINQDPCF